MDVALLFRSTRSRRSCTSERINLRRLAAFGSKRNEPNPICGMGDDDKKSSWAVCLENEIIFHRRMDFAKHITRFFGETGAVSARRRLAGCTVGCTILYTGVPKVQKYTDSRIIVLIINDSSSQINPIFCIKILTVIMIST